MRMMRFIDEKLLQSVKFKMCFTVSGSVSTKGRKGQGSELPDADRGLNKKISLQKAMRVCDDKFG